MTFAQTNELTFRKPLRLWPGVLIVVLQWLVRFVVPAVFPEALIFGVMGGLVGGLGVAVWWVFFSRARWSERLGAIAVMIGAMVATSRVIHLSIATGMMGMMFPVYAIPVLSLALVVWAVTTRRLSDGLRRVSMVAAILLGCGMLTLVRTDGITGSAGSDFHWRWTPTPEQRLLAQAGDEPATVPTAPATVKTPEERLGAPTGNQPAAVPSAPAAAKTAETPETAADWPGFRGPQRDGVVRGVRIKTDWAASPPVEL